MYTSHDYAVCGGESTHPTPTSKLFYTLPGIFLVMRKPVEDVMSDILSILDSENE